MLALLSSHFCSHSLSSMMEFGAAEGLASLWALCYLLASRVMPRIFGTELCGGQERWRNAWGVPNQLGTLPLLYIVNGAICERCFHYVFLLYMLLDFVLLSAIDNMIIAHHVVCLVGHAIVSILVPAGFSTYFAGVVALEIGGGFANLFDLGTSRWWAVIYFVGMSVSNVMGAYVAWQWLLLPLAMAPKVLCLLLTAGLIVGRQNACWEAVSGSRSLQKAKGG